MVVNNHPLLVGVGNLKGRDDALRRPRPQRSAGRNERGWTKIILCVRWRRLTLRSATRTAQRAIPTNHRRIE